MGKRTLGVGIHEMTEEEALSIWFSGCRPLGQVKGGPLSCFVLLLTSSHLRLSQANGCHLGNF